MTDNGQFPGSQSRKAPVGGWIFLLLAAAGALLLLLGRNALTGLEGDAAEGCRRLLTEVYDPFSPSGWHPDSLRALAYSRLLKPLVLLLGKTELVLRLPSVIFALAMLSGTGILTRELSGSGKTALLAGWLLLGSYGFLFWGRCIHPAMLESSCILWGAVIVYCGGAMGTFSRAFFWYLLLLLLWVFNGFIGASMLILMTIPVLIGEWKAHNFAFRRKIAALFAVLPVSLFACAFFFHGSLPWLGWEEEVSRALQCQSGLWHDAVTRFTDGHFTDWWYGGAENLVRLILPWPLLCIIAAGALFEKRRELSRKQKDVMLSGLLIFCLFGIFPVRRWQNLLPLLPILCALTASGLALCGKEVTEQAGDHWMLLLKKLMYWFCAFLGAVAVVLPVTWPIWQPLFQLPPPTSMLIIVPLFGICALTALIFCGGENSITEKLIGSSGRLSGTIFACTALSVSILAVVLPALTEFRTERSFLLKVHSGLRQYSKIVFVGKSPSSQALFYLAVPGEIATAYNGSQLKLILQDAASFGLIGRNKKEVWTIIAESGAPVDLQKPLEKENTPIRLWQTGDSEGEYLLWRGVNHQDHNNNLEK